MSFNSLINSLVPGMNPDGIMAAIQREFNELNMRIENLEKRLRVVEPDRITGKSMTDIEFLYSLGVADPVEAVPVGRSYTADQVKSPDQQRMSINKFKEAFGRRVIDDLTLCQPTEHVIGNTEQKKEEVHAAHTSSFVLKI